MRPPRTQRSALRYPLDGLLGSPALVRLTRVLVHDVAGPVSVTDAARMAGLSTNGARKALESLESLGIASRVGTGRAQKFGLKEGNPYVTGLAQLYGEEQRQYEDLLAQLLRAVGIPEVRDAWIGSLPMAPERALQLDVVVESNALGWIGSELRTRLIDTEKRFDLIIELALHTRADKPVIPEGAIVLWGPGDLAETDRSPGARTHAQSEERSLRMAEVVAELIRSDASLVRRALQHTNRLLHEGQGTANSDLAEWRQLLETYSAERLRDLLVSSSSRAERLRRSSPFFAVLTPEERDRIAKELQEAR